MLFFTAFINYPGMGIANNDFDITSESLYQLILSILKVIVTLKLEQRATKMLLRIYI